MLLKRFRYRSGKGFKGAGLVEVNSITLIGGSHVGRFFCPVGDGFMSSRAVPRGINDYGYGDLYDWFVSLAKVCFGS